MKTLFKFSIAGFLALACILLLGGIAVAQEDATDIDPCDRKFFMPGHIVHLTSNVVETDTVIDPCDRKFFMPGYVTNRSNDTETVTIDPGDRKFFMPGHIVHLTSNVAETDTVIDPCDRKFFMPGHIVHMSRGETR